MLTKNIVTNDDLSKWIDSPTYTELVSFVVELQDLVEGKPNDVEVEVSAASAEILSLLDTVVSKAIADHPVIHERDISRFGKVEFRDFYDQLQVEVPQFISKWLLQTASTSTSTEDAAEISDYLVDSFGNRTRIDYGSGHELNFIVFLLCLRKSGVIASSDYPCIVLRVFNRYMSIMRLLQRTYWLEPAGSHGVWGLDDYHFLPFLFGSSQLATHPHMRPKLIHNAELVDQFYKLYMYLECIHFINSIKTIPANKANDSGNQEPARLSLRWHSPMLDDILAAKSWMKIKEGMVKMYKAEVLAKLPIMQHLKFGNLVKCPEGIEYQDHNRDTEDDSCAGHVHEAVNTWGDCCGIKVPSAIAASEMNKLKNKPIPFD